MRKLAFILMIAVCILGQTVSGQKIKFDDMASHPRLLLKAGEESRIKETLVENGHLKEIHRIIIAKSDELITMPTLVRNVLGRRLLYVSRDAIMRIFYLSYAYRMTGEAKYRDRAIQEMMSICMFEDWNPTHFLDVAEMTLGVAIGYDWLYDELSVDQKKVIRKAIVEKGLIPSKNEKYFDFYHSHNNWNQVCNGGMLFGALAVYEDEPELAGMVVKRTLETIGQPLEYYKPDGAYPEGYGYWGYGTGYQVMINSALESAFGTDFGLADSPGLKESAEFILFLSATSGKAFNYSDNREGLQSNPVLYWFADKYKTPSLIYIEKDLITQQASTRENNRFLPCALIYGSKIDFSKVLPPAKKLWVGEGINPVILIRTDWKDKEGVYVGVKAGTAAYSHGHMDVGSFVFDALGERWAMDLGLQNYHSLESAGVDLWNMKQGSQRWSVFRYANQQHNTLTINGKHQRVEGKARIMDVYDSKNKLGGRIDLSEAYSEEVAEVVRDVALIKENYLQITDYIKTSLRPADITWTMVTPAQINQIDNKTLKLTQNDKSITFSVKTSDGVDLSYAPATPPMPYDEANPGVSLIKISFRIKPESKSSIRVELKPDSKRK